MADYRNANGLKARTIVVKKADLLAKLKENRELHIKEFKEAETEFVEAALILLDKKKAEVTKALKELRTKLEKGPVTLALDVNSYFSIQPPTSYESSYTEAIEMTEWETRDEVELDSNEFKRYIKNNWEWTETFNQNKRLYFAATQVGFDK